jgi:hypothetical protein
MFEWRRYVPAAKRRAKAVRHAASLRRGGQSLAPVVTRGRTIASTFWGKAWCDNLERYSDYANRLPRGRTYVRNGSVIDLHVGAGRISAQVMGSDLLPDPGKRHGAAAGALAGLGLGLHGLQRFARRAATGALLPTRHAAHLGDRHRTLSLAGRPQVQLQLPGLGRDVQARCGGAVWRRRPLGFSAGAAVHTPQGRCHGPGRARR